MQFVYWIHQHLNASNEFIQMIRFILDFQGRTGSVADELLHYLQGLSKSESRSNNIPEQ